MLIGITIAVVFIAIVVIATKSKKTAKPTKGGSGLGEVQPKETGNSDKFQD